MPFRVVRAGTTDAAGIIVPDSASVVSGRRIHVRLPRGEYELVVGTGVTARLSYDVSFGEFGADVTSSFDTYVVPGVELEQRSGGAEQPAPEVGVPQAVGSLFIVPMRDPARRRLRVTVSFSGEWQPVVAVSARRDGSAVRGSLAIDRSGGAARTLVVDVSTMYQEALVYVIQPKPLPQEFRGTYRLRID